MRAAHDSSSQSAATAHSCTARDSRPLDETCACAVCATFSRAYLCHLFRAGEMLGPRLLSYHNLAVLVQLMADARRAISENRWTAFRESF